MMKRIFSLLLTLSLLGTMLVVPAFAADKTLTLREDWRLTSNFDLKVPADDTLTIQGSGQFYIYEMGGHLLNSGGGTVTFAEGTILYPAADDENAEKITPTGIWDSQESNALMALRAGGHLVNIAPTSGGTVTTDKLAAKAGDTVKFTITPSTGYQQDTVTVMDGNSEAVTVSNNAFEMPASEVTITVTFKLLSSNKPGNEPSGEPDDDSSNVPGGGSSSGGSSSSGSSSSGSGNTTTETTTNSDGSTTTTQTNKTTGTVTETTKYPDGSSEVVETKKDGTVTTTSTDSDGNKTQSVEKPDGTSETTVTIPDGSTSTTKVDADGKTETVVKLPASVVADAADKAEAVSLPMPEVTATSDSASAPTVTVDLPSGRSAKVEIPVRNAKITTVAVLVGADGTEQVKKTSVTTENGVTVTLSDGDTVKIVDNSKSFADVPAAYWGANAVAFAASHELMGGTSSTQFSPDTAMSRAMIVTVLARLDGVDTSTGANWYDAGRDWAMQAGISDGTNMDGTLTREQLATMLYRYAQSKGQGFTGAWAFQLDYPDADAVSEYAYEAMCWTTMHGIIGGMGDGTLQPQGPATRAEVATMLMRFISNVD